LSSWWIVVCAVCCAALLVCERAESRVGVWVAKPLAAASFVAFGLAQTPFDRSYGICILVGLCLSWCGDVLLIPNDKPRVFLAGIGAFLSAHVAYCVGFFSLGSSGKGLAMVAALVLPAAVIVMRWLRPRLDGVFVHAVPVYVVVIAAMVVASGGAAFELSRFDMLLGASVFAVSDVAVARDRFVAPGFANGLWGLPLYFAAQLVLAASIAAPAP
jgi:uncharacterized membrane protein YhhN